MSVNKASKKTDLLNFLFFLGRPFSLLYAGIMKLRAFLYKKGIINHQSLAARVISVGNLTMGGTGKTPMVIYLAKLLRDMGANPAVLSRGYQGKANEEVNIVSDNSTIYLDAVICGDEPRLIAESLPGIPVLTGKQRVLTGQKAIESYNVDTLILDDAFQHLAIDRDLNLALFNAQSLANKDFLFNSWVVPAGELREPLSALERADAFVITGANINLHENLIMFKDNLIKCFPNIPVFTGKYSYNNPLLSLNNNSILQHELKEQPLLAFCGIAKPQSFLKSLDECDFDIVDSIIFADHHHYTSNDFELLFKKAADCGAQAIITTEKDFVKLPKNIQSPTPVYALPVELVMEDSFQGFVKNHLGK